MISKRYRRRVIEPLAVVGVATIVLIAHAPTDLTSRLDLPGARRSAPTPPAVSRLEPTCPHETTTQPVTVSHLNAVVSSLDLRYWQAADIGASGRLSDRRLVFVFGDTLREPDVAPNMVANSVIVTSGLCASQLITPEAGPVIPDRADGVVQWPTSLVVLPGDGSDRFVVFSSRIRRDGAGPFAFTYLGATATLFDVPRGGVPARVGSIDVTPDSSDLDQVNWGGAAMVAGDWMYVYGTSRTNAGPGRTLYVARAPLEAPSDRSRWRFWNGGSWQPDSRVAEPVLSDGVSQTLSADLIDGRYVLVSKRGGDFGNEIYSWTSKHPTGPWRRSTGVPAEFRDAAGGFSYAPIAHPEIPLASGKLAVSVSRNTDDLGRLLQDPRAGRPYVTEIDWPR